jgi:DsbC/DsbD-like thiol-disulfide interchange protein
MRSLTWLVLLLPSFALSIGTADYVRLGKIKPLTLKASGKGELQIPVLIKDGFHIQSHPAAAANLIATDLTIDAKKDLQLGEPIFPAPQKMRVLGMEQDITVYTGDVVIKMPISAAPGAKPGKLTLVGTLKCQACNDKTCFLPSKIPLSTTIVLKK